MHVFTPVFSVPPLMRMFHACSTLALHERTYIAATRLVYTAAILALVTYFQMVGQLKGIVKQCIKFFVDQKGDLSEPPRTPPAYRPDLPTASLFNYDSVYMRSMSLHFYKKHFQNHL